MALQYPHPHHLQHPHPHHLAMAPRRRDDEDDEFEDNMAYLPGSGPSLEISPDYPYEDPGAFAGAPPPGFVTAFWNPYEVKHRRRTSRAQLAVLEREFDTDPKPNADKRRSLAAQLNMTPRAIQVWFQNRRAKIKAIKNKIPGGRGMPKLKPGEKAASRAARSAVAAPSKTAPDSDDEDEEKPPADPWLEISPDVSPSSPSFPSGPDPALVSSPLSEGRTPPASSSAKPHFTIAVPPPDASGPTSAAHSGPSSPDFIAPPPPPHGDFLAPPSPAALLRRGSAPAPLQGIHRARFSTFNAARGNGNGELELGLPPVSPISPPDHDVAPVRRASLVGLGRRPSLPDSHLRLPAHPYYAHPYERPGPGGGPRMQRRGGLLSPVPDVGHEQEQSHAPYRYNDTMPLPTMLPPAPSVHPTQNQEHSPQSRMYRALLPGMGSVPAAHDLPTQFPARPAAYGGSWGRSQSIGNNQLHQPQQLPTHVPARPFAVPVAGPLPAADFSFGAPEPGHGDAFTRVMGQEGGEMDVEFGNGNVSPSGEFVQSPLNASPPNQPGGEFGGELTRSNGEFAPPNSNGNNAEHNSNEYSNGNTTDYAPPMWDARTRFGSMASVASDVTGVSVSSTQATSVSGGLGTAGFGNGECEGFGFGDARAGAGFGDARGFGHGYTLSAGYPAGFQPDVRRASCPGEFLHQFSGMGVNNNGSNSNGGGNEGGARSTSLTHLRPSMLGRSLTLAADAQLPSPNSNPHVTQGQQQQNSSQGPRGLTISSEGRHGVNLALAAKSLRSPTFPPGQVDPTYPPPPPGPSVGAVGGGPFAPREAGENVSQQMGQGGHQSGQHMPQSSQHMNQANLSSAQRALVGGGFGSEPSYPMSLATGYDANNGFETHTPPSFETSPNMGGGVDGMGIGGVDGMNVGGLGMNVHGSSGKGSPMLFAGVGVEGEPFDMNAMSPDSLAMAMIGQEYGMPGGFSFP